MANDPDVISTRRMAGKGTFRVVLETKCG
jgi:hypothetical protein